MRLTAQSIKRWSFIHRWASLICTVFLLVLCLTGLPLVFKDEIDDWIYNEAELQTTADAAEAQPLDRLVEIAQSRFPTEFFQVLFWNPSQPNMVTFVLGPVERAVSLVGMHGLTLDERTGDVVSEPKPRRGVTFYLKLHTDLFLGLPMTLFYGVMGLIFLLSLVS